MKHALLLASLVCSLAQAAPIFESKTPDGSATLVLHDDVCQWAESARLAVWRPKEGQTIQGCWIEVDDYVLVVYVDGDSGIVNKGAFVKVISL